MSEETVERDSRGVKRGVKVGQRTQTEAKAAAPQHSALPPESSTWPSCPLRGEADSWSGTLESVIGSGFAEAARNCMRNIKTGRALWKVFFKRLQGPQQNRAILRHVTLTY